MFSQIPNNLSSLYSELLYTFYSSYSTDMTIQIFEDESSELLGVKKFYSTSSAQLNIAPHLRSYALPTLESYPAGFISPYRNGNISVYLKMVEQSVSSSVRQFTLSRSDIDLRGLLSSMPVVRTISDGDSDQLYIAAESNSAITVTQKHYLSSWSSSYERPYSDGEFTETLVATSSSSTTPTDGNIVIFNFVAESLADGDATQIERVVVSVSQNSEQIAEVTYHIVEPSSESIRLAWLSEYGSIEHYTFPAVKESYVGEVFQKTLTLTSAFEGYATRAALAEIVRSQRIWVDNDGVYLEATAEDGDISLSSTGSLGCVDIRISYLE